ncbi:MAG: iron-containing alcohol dehydrogenase [Lachnospiraceae bacterium]|nr:iron-containing alcohol dehydrogenase [Lachnospiraceae bacterium]
MKDFDVRIPTRVIFGKEKEKEVGSLIKAYGYQKVLLHYGRGSAKKAGQS